MAQNESYLWCVDLRLVHQHDQHVESPPGFPYHWTHFVERVCTKVQALAKPGPSCAQCDMRRKRDNHESTHIADAWRSAANIPSVRTAAHLLREWGRDSPQHKHTSTLVQIKIQGWADSPNIVEAAFADFANSNIWPKESIIFVQIFTFNTLIFHYCMPFFINSSPTSTSFPWWLSSTGFWT